jgi:hypothetical protein
MKEYAMNDADAWLWLEGGDGPNSGAKIRGVPFLYAFGEEAEDYKDSDEYVAYTQRASFFNPVFGTSGKFALPSPSATAADDRDGLMIRMGPSTWATMPSFAEGYAPDRRTD